MASTTQLPSLPRLETDHRKLLNPQHLDDSPITDQDDTPDDIVAALADDNVIGVSISRAQTYMKSPHTPAVEKQRILNQADDYFPPDIAANPSNSESDATTPAERPPAVHSRTEPAAVVESTSTGTSLPTPWTSCQTPQSRPSLATALTEAKDVTKRRSMSGSNLFESLMKMVPDLPSMPSMPNFPSIPTIPVLRSQSFFSTRTDDSPRTPDASSQTLSRYVTAQTIQPKRHSDPPLPSSPLTRDLHQQGLDGSVESLLVPTSPASSRGRRNSESSIYLSRKVSGMSAFDDINAFAHVTEMANSRFKAITDSFQSSTIRFPRLPNVKTHFGKPSTKEDETSRNTEINARPSSKEREKHYTNLHNIRKSKKLIEIETSQNRAHPIFFDALNEIEGDLVIMGGYRGSILREAKAPHRQLWAPVKVGLNLRKADLEVGLTKEDEERATEKIIPGGILSHIGPIDICKRLLKHARKCPNIKSGQLRVHDWGYDWRLSPDLLAGRLIKFLEGLECNQANVPPQRRGAWMIAHSLGGLITRYVVNQRPELFAGVLYAGTPMNCVNILGPLRNGDDVLLSSKVLTAQVNFTIRTSFALLPEDGRCFLDRETGERFDLDFFDPQTWEDWHLSPCIKAALDPPNAKQRERSKSLVGLMAQSVTSLPRPQFLSSNPDTSRTNSHGPYPSPSQTQTSSDQSNATSSKAADIADRAAQYADNIVSEPLGGASLEPSMSNARAPAHRPSVATACTLDPQAAREYLARTLTETLAFKRALVHNPSRQSANRYPPHALIFGKTVPTVYGAKVACKEAIKYVNAFEDLAFAAGDGVVLASAAQLPEGYRVVKGGRIESDRGHVGLMGDLEGVGRGLKALLDGRRRGVGMGCYDRA